MEGRTSGTVTDSEQVYVAPAQPPAQGDSSTSVGTGKQTEIYSDASLDLPDAAPLPAASDCANAAVPQSLPVASASSSPPLTGMMVSTIIGTTPSSPANLPEPVATARGTSVGYPTGRRLSSASMRVLLPPLSLTTSMTKAPVFCSTAGSDFPLRSRKNSSTFRHLTPSPSPSSSSWPVNATGSMHVTAAEHVVLASCLSVLAVSPQSMGEPLARLKSHGQWQVIDHGSTSDSTGRKNPRAHSSNVTVPTRTVPILQPSGSDTTTSPAVSAFPPAALAGQHSLKAGQVTVARVVTFPSAVFAALLSLHAMVSVILVRLLWTR